MKTVIVYASLHHRNTLSVAAAMAAESKATLIDLLQTRNLDISSYDCIGFASGVYHGALHTNILALIRQGNFSPTTKTFTVTTCGIPYRNYAAAAAKELAARSIYLGNFQTRGFDTAGIFSKIGGIARGRPNAKDLRRATEFIRRCAEKDSLHT